jgi:hypothetical protein
VNPSTQTAIKDFYGKVAPRSGRSDGKYFATFANNSLMEGQNVYIRMIFEYDKVINSGSGNYYLTSIPLVVYQYRQSNIQFRYNGGASVYFTLPITSFKDELNEVVLIQSIVNNYVRIYINGSLITNTGPKTFVFSGEDIKVLSNISGSGLGDGIVHFLEMKVEGHQIIKIDNLSSVADASWENKGAASIGNATWDTTLGTPGEQWYGSVDRDLDSLMPIRTKALQFNGTSQYLSIANFDTGLPSNNYFCVCVFKGDVIPNNYSAFFSYTGTYLVGQYATPTAFGASTLYLTTTNTGIVDNMNLEFLLGKDSNWDWTKIHQYAGWFSYIRPAAGPFYPHRSWGDGKTVVNGANTSSAAIPSTDYLDGSGNLLIGSDRLVAGRYLQGQMLYFALWKDFDPVKLKSVDQYGFPLDGDVENLKLLEWYNNTLLKNPSLVDQENLELFIDFNNPFDNGGTLQFPDLSPNNHTVVANGYTDLATLQSNLVDIDTLR